MLIHTIVQKMSGTGSIHDIASDLYDRDIKFPKGAKYAVVLSSFYGGKGYTTHKSMEAAIAQSHKLQDYSHSVIDSVGSRYAVNQDFLEKFD